MRAEFDIDGVFLSSVVATAGLAFVATALLRQLIKRAGLARFIWHSALFETSLFVLLWAAISALPFGI